jgi:sec-independent protein translocase protein TatC
MKDIDDSKAPLLDHLIELRKRLLMSFGALGVAFLVCLYFAEPIFAILVQPLLKVGQGKLIYTDIFEAFFVNLKVAFFAALMIAFPVLATQVWRFVAPGLYVKEKKALLPFLLLTPVLFTAGASLAYFVAVPIALKYLLVGFTGNVGGIEREALPAIGNYLSFITKFLFGFGVAFLLPVLLMLLERAGIVTRLQLIKGRRYAIVGVVAVAAVLTPPDIVSQLLLAVPLVLLYELAIIAIWFTEKRRKTETADEESDEADPGVI